MTTPNHLSLLADLYGCPNRCLHCWLGHMPNRSMGPDADRFLMDCFDPYFAEIEFYSWLREPDFCPDYRERWARDLAISKNARPERFELASFWRIVRDDAYVPFLREVGVRKVQLSFFGRKETQDRYVGRPGAWEELLEATDRLIAGGITPRWQCFINEENKDELVEVWRLAQRLRAEKCPELEFFVHEGSCEGENRKLYPIRIRMQDVPEELRPVYLDYDRLRTERDCRAALLEDHSHPSWPLEDSLVLYVSNTWDLFFNYTHMRPVWAIGNLKETPAEELMRRIYEGDTFALREAGKLTWSELAARYGDPASERAFSMGDYRDFLVNEHLEGIYS